MIAETIVIVCTVTKTYKTYREGQRFGVRLPVTTYILRQGKYIISAMILI